MNHTMQFYIDGRWVEPTEARPFDVIDPSTEESIAQIALGGPKDVDLAVGAARRAFETFSQTTPRGALEAAARRSPPPTRSATPSWRRRSRRRWARRSGSRTRRRPRPASGT